MVQARALTPGTLTLAVCGVLCTGVLVTLPVLATAMAQQIGGDASALGYLASADMFGSAVASLVLAPFAKRLKSSLVVRLALALAIVANFAACAAHGFALLLTLRVAAGFFTGVTLCLVFIGLCKSPAPDRAFAVYTFAQLVLQIALLPLFGLALNAFGPESLYLLLNLTLVPVVVAAAIWPQIFTIPAGAPSAQGAAPGFWPLLSVIGLGIYFIAPGMIWANLDGIGRAFGVDTVDVGATLGAASLSGVAGAAAAIALTGSKRNGLWLILGVLLSIASLAPIFLGGGKPAFWALAIAFNFAWNFTFPYLMDVVALFDKEGEAATHSLASQLLGLAIGPAVAGTIYGAGFNNAAIAGFALIIFGLSLVAFLAARRRAAFISAPR